MKLKDIFSKDNMFSFAAGAIIIVGVVVGATAVSVGIGVAPVAFAAGIGFIIVGFGVAGGVVIGSMAVEKKFGLELKLAPLLAGIATVVGIAIGAAPSNVPQASQELSAVSEPATVQMVQMSDRVEPLRISFTTTVDPDSVSARLPDNTGPAHLSYELRMA